MTLSIFGGIRRFGLWVMSVSLIVGKGRMLVIGVAMDKNAAQTIL